ncbi:MAG: tetratricopeptide repeat protein [Phycisphaerales bacterium]|nr:tetratricopeptide repeat protein [Phycisphaerales bacterium]
MAYVRRRGNQLAIVHGARDPNSRKVEQQVLFTIYSKKEALEILGRGQPAGPAEFQRALEAQNPGVRFDWDKVDAAIAQNLDALPETYDYVGTRLRDGFRPDLRRFIRRLMLTDPQWLSSSWQLIDEHRKELVFLRDLIDWRLGIEKPSPAAAEWMADNPFHWRYAMSSREVPSDAEDFARDYEKGDLDMAEAVFGMLTETFDGYAEGYNFLGLIAFDREDYPLAIARFQKCIDLGRKLLPKRVAKDRWWSDDATRPYMRGLRNLALTYNHAGQHEKALEVCDLLERECHDEVCAAGHRSAACLSLGDWQGALRAALHIHRIAPHESLTAALAAYELGRLDDARAWFVHAMMNVPRSAARRVGRRLPEPRGSDEVSDHNGGVVLHGSIPGFFARRSRSSSRFFASLWSEFAGLRDELRAARVRCAEDRTGQDRSAFDRIEELCTLAFAERYRTAPAASRDAVSAARRR